MADLNSVNPKKVRIVGKIKGGIEQEYKSLTPPWITFKNPQENGSSEKSLVFFDAQSTSRRDVYELDYCYGQDEETDLIYSREIKPLILEAFSGRNASIIALGARGSGKTYTIQGSKERPGLAVMAMSEILSKARELGKLVSVSLYELTQDHAYDLLDPKHSEVQVLDAHGKINLKGLSQVHVQSIEEFSNIYFSQGSFHKTQKLSMDQPRNHKGLMVHISSDDDQLKPKLTNKINFVDLAGYEDPKRSRRDGTTLVESNRTNKSLYALLNVISALSANETHLPYRASKFTRILQDSLHGRSHILLLTCLNAFFCEDTISSISLVSRSYRSTKQVLTDSTNRSQSSAKPKVLSSLKGGKPVSASLSAKKQVSHSRLLSEQKASCTTKGRKLFDEGKRIKLKQLKCMSEDTSSHKAKNLPDLASEVSSFSLEEAQPDKNMSEVSPTVEPTHDVNTEALGFPSTPELQRTLLLAAPDENLAIVAEKEVSSHGTINHHEATSHIYSDAKPQNQFGDEGTYEVNDYIYKKNDGSPPLSEKIKEISNNLKALYSSTPLRIKMSEVAAPPHSSQVEHNGALVPKSPVMELGSQVEYNDDLVPKSPVMELGSQVEHNDALDPKTPVTEPGSAKHFSPHGTLVPKSPVMEHNGALVPKSPVMELGSQVEYNDDLVPKSPVMELGSQVEHNDALDPKTPVTELGSAKHFSPHGTFGNRISGVKHSVVQEYLKFLNSSSKEELKSLRGIGEKRATYILELREESPEPFKTLDDLQDIGMSAKQIKGMMRQVAGQLFIDN